MTVKQLILLLQVDHGNFDFNKNHEKELRILEKAKLIRYNDLQEEWVTLPKTQIKIAAILELL